MAGITGGRVLRADDFPAGTLERIMSHTIRQGRCRLWSRCTNGSGHPTITIHRGQYLTRRVLYALVHGECPARIPVATTCQDPLCLAPSHLRVFRAGEQNDATTTVAEARRIRALRRTHSIPAIAEIIGVGEGAVAAVCHNRPTHRHHDPTYERDSTVAGKRTRRVGGLTDTDVRAARRAVARGSTFASQAERYEVAYSTMHDAVSGQTFKWVAPTESAPLAQPRRRTRQTTVLA